jgi:hypothetical protein
MPRRQTGRTATALVGAAAGAVLVTGAAYAASAAASDPDPVAASAGSLQVSAAAGAERGTLLPGGSAGGSLFVRNPGPAPVQLPTLELRPVTTAAPGCDPAAVAFALLTAPTPSAPLLVPAAAQGQEGTVVVGYTAFLAAEAAPACRGARFRSEVVAVDAAGRSVVLGAASATAGVLPTPPAPTASRTTATTAELRWSAPPGLPTEVRWIVERAPHGTDAGWTAACGSAAAPLPSTSCTDSALTPCTGYAYRVVAVVGRWRATSRPREQVRTTSA